MFYGRTLATLLVPTLLSACGLAVSPTTSASLATGTLDTSFHSTWGGGFTGPVDALAEQSDGAILVAGRFTQFDGLSRGGLLRLSADGSLDATFGPFTISPTSASVYAVAVQSDGKILVAGDFTSFHGSSTRGLARLKSDGSLDTSFATGSFGFDGAVNTISLSSTSEIFVGGAFSVFGANSAPRIAKLKSDGSFDSSFAVGTGFALAVNSVVVESDGRVLVGGAFTTYQGVSRYRLVRLNSNGTLDDNFALAVGTGFNGVVAEILSFDDGILVGGDFSLFNGATASSAVQLGAFGDLKAELSATGAIYAFATDAQGNVLMGGDTTRLLNLNTGARLIRFSPTTYTHDTDFATQLGSGFDGTVRAIRVLSDGKILVGGEFSAVSDQTVSSLARLK